MLSIPDGECFEFQVTGNVDSRLVGEAFIAHVGNYSLAMWSDGSVHVTRHKFIGDMTTETTLEKIWDEEM